MLDVTSTVTVVVVAALASAASASAQFFADWSVLARDRQPSCVAIPANMSLCQNVGYTKMRLPNLLDHDTMQEASQQASSWVPLLNIKCHQDTQLFLCSLFAPLCLERPIYPCRSLCQKVKAGCISTMENHGFPWPSMLDCDKFPLDNDMCITSQSDKKQETPSRTSSPSATSKQQTPESVEEKSCNAKMCNQAGTYENILANYCQADFVVKMKFKEMKRRTAVGRKVNAVYKTWRGTAGELRKLRKPRLRVRDADECCSGWLDSQPNRQRYLVMGKKEGNRLVPTFIHPWKKSNEDLKRARRMFQQIDCSNLRETSHRVIAESIAPHGGLYHRETESRKRRRTLKSMFDFRDYDGTIGTGMYNSQILANPGPRASRGGGGKLRRRGGGGGERKKRRRHNRGGNGLRRRSRLQENWLEDTSSSPTRPSAVKSQQHENELFSPENEVDVMAAAAGVATASSPSEDETKNDQVAAVAVTRRRPRHNADNATS